MQLHITFSDGSNPWLSLKYDRQSIYKQWKKWMKYHPDTAQPVAFNGEYAVYPYLIPGKNKFDGYDLRKRNYNDFDDYICYDFVKHYKHLGHALLALERLGGK